MSAAVKIINRNINSTTGYSPFFLLYGYKPFNAFERKLGIQNLETVPEHQSQESDEYTVNTLQKAREEAIESIQEANESGLNSGIKTSEPLLSKSEILCISSTVPLKSALTRNSNLQRLDSFVSLKRLSKAPIV